MLSAHLYQFHAKYGHVYRFNCQQLEKKNHSNTTNIFRSTNFNTNLSEKDDFLVQLINKNNRLEYLNKFDSNLVKKVRVRMASKRKRMFNGNYRKTKF